MLQLWKSYYESLEKQGSFQFTKSILFKNDAVFSALDLSLNGDVRSFKQFDANNNVSLAILYYIKYLILIYILFSLILSVHIFSILKLVKNNNF